jgi:hypothetical protein
MLKILLVLGPVLVAMDYNNKWTTPLWNFTEMTEGEAKGENNVWIKVENF